VRAVEARGLPAAGAGDGLWDTYVQVRLGKQRAKTRVAHRTLSPVGDLRDQLLVTVIQDDRYFADDVLSQVKVPVLTSAE
jgi:hypothetical protein